MDVKSIGYYYLAPQWKNSNNKIAFTSGASALEKTLRNNPDSVTADVVIEHMPSSNGELSKFFEMILTVIREQKAGIEALTKDNRKYQRRNAIVESQLKELQSTNHRLRRYRDKKR